MANKKYVCIHGHFYQPPRENAWLEFVEVQDSAHPYHDWNRRISAECYAANAFSRILDDAGYIVQIINNYERMSFNFGPTLLAWMEDNVPEVYAAILKADRKSMQRYSGHGGAIAQAYNHIIMPLANSRDKLTQILWGIRDFVHRFGRYPEGMWLPETAVDMETLRMLADQRIKFTILSPSQAMRCREMGKEKWQDVSDGSIDPKLPYIQRLPNGKRIDIFFYDGPISRAVAFEGLLKSGEAFAKRLLGGFAERDDVQLSHIATDGESYGHHARYGDMALAYAMNYIEENKLAGLTNYGEFLEMNPPTHEVQIMENTAWSCVHGVERWRSDCGCSTGQHPDWRQQWRRPLREALDQIRDKAAPMYEKKMSEYVADPWAARNDYVDVILNRSTKRIEDFLYRNARKPLTAADEIRVLKLLEMQRQALLMYTSCGWFFDEISGIETVQVIQYAARMVQLYHEIFGADLEAGFLEKMSEAESNIPANKNGRRTYEKFVQPAMVDLKKVAAHYAISAIFEEMREKDDLFCYSVAQKEYHGAEAGMAKLAAGRVEIVSNITQESDDIQFAVLYMGDHNLTCGISRDLNDIDFKKMVDEIAVLFDRADFTKIIQTMNMSFRGAMVSVLSLFKDGQRKVLNRILQDKREAALSVFRHLYEPNVPLMRFLRDSATPAPGPLYLAGGFVINSELRELFSEETMDHRKIQYLLKEADLAGIDLDASTLEYTLRKNLENMAERLSRTPEQCDVLKRLSAGVELVYALPFDVLLRKVQNYHYGVGQSYYRTYVEKARQGDGDAAEWIELYKGLSEKLLIRMTGIAENIRSGDIAP